jgi:hypothetical protein
LFVVQCASDRLGRRKQLLSLDPHDYPYLCRACSRTGSIAGLEWLHTRGVPWPSEPIPLADLSIQVLTWLFDNGAPLGPCTSPPSKLEVIQFLHQRKCAVLARSVHPSCLYRHVRGVALGPVGWPSMGPEVNSEQYVNLSGALHSTTDAALAWSENRGPK